MDALVLLLISIVVSQRATSGDVPVGFPDEPEIKNPPFFSASCVRLLVVVINFLRNFRLLILRDSQKYIYPTRLLMFAHNRAARFFKFDLKGRHQKGSVRCF